jgi:translation initiation factor 2B subunit (eIF-2B alpha/beta/delta family)/ADP-ribose pyrophosphatase YjhB (NUDIX family)
MTDVVTVFLQHEGEILLLRRSEAVGTYRRQWGGVSGYVESETADPREDAERELQEEVGAVDAALRRRGTPIHVVDEENELAWTVHPFRYDAPDRAVDPNEEVAEWEWVSPPAMLDRPCVPRLWGSYRRVGPTVADVAGDDRSGAAEISLRALAVLRDGAAEAAHAAELEAPEWSSHDAIRDGARRLRDAHPEMAVVANRVNRVMATSDGLDGLADRAHEVLLAARTADRAAASEAAELLQTGATGPPTVVTLSRSGTALEAIQEADASVVIGESRTAREGVDVAEELVAAGQSVTVTTDAALPSVVSGDVGPAPDAAVVGADAVFPDGEVVNKVGTRPLGLACERADLPLYVVAARDKIATEQRKPTEEGDPAALYGGDADVAVENPVFDRTPADCVSGVVTEDGALDDEELAAAVRTHREHAAWDR